VRGHLFKWDDWRGCCDTAAYGTAVGLQGLTAFADFGVRMIKKARKRMEIARKRMEIARKAVPLHPINSFYVRNILGRHHEEDI
jgi:hypothetical protein